MVEKPKHSSRGQSEKSTVTRNNRLTIIREVERTKQGHRRVECLCNCGNIITVHYSHVLTGHTKSCGCLKKEGIRSNPIQHGDCVDGNITVEYYAWIGMRTRCLNSVNKDYKHYGGRGIKICERWLSFKNFLADMGRKPSNKHSLDRIDNDGDYEPNNCRWATAKEQANNRRICMISATQLKELYEKIERLARYEQLFGVLPENA